MVRVVALVAALVFTAACSSDNGRGSEPDSPLALYRGVPSEDDAVFRGTLVREGPCLYIDDGRHRVLLLFSADAASWKGGKLHVGRVTAAPGDRVGIGGGGASGLSNFEWVREPHESCDTSAAWVSGSSLHR